MIEFPPFRLDPNEGRLWKGETILTLRRKPFAILCFLAAHPGKLITHAELFREVWAGAVVSDSAMRSHLHELRQVLGDGVIETVVGRGYRFVAKLRQARLVDDAIPSVAPDPLVVGRDAELEALGTAFERALGGRRQLCFVTGEPGIGKSTLVRTFLSRLDARTVSVASGGCFEQHGTPEPLFAIIEAFGELVRSERAAHVLQVFLRYAPTFLAQLPQWLSDAQLAEVTRRAAGGSEARQLREVCEALERLCSREPLVLVLENLQWSDVATIDLLSLLGQRQQPAQLLVIATSRYAEAQDATHPFNRVMRALVSRSGALAIPVSRMDAGAIQRFIDRRFPGHLLPAQLTELVAKITGGTPLFLVALLDELVGRGMLCERNGTWSLLSSLEDVQGHRPASVTQLIDIQLDRLPAPEQRVLEAASVVGTEFLTDLVAAALEQPLEQVDDVCAALALRFQFLRPQGAASYSFSHGLIQEVCAERSSPARRQRWHRLVAEAMERSSGAGEVSQLLAQHFDAAGEVARALPAYAAAARQAGQRYATSNAIALCVRALDMVPRLPEGRVRDELELELLGTLCRQFSSSTFHTAFAGRDPLQVHTRAIEIARRLGDVAALYGALTRMCNYNMVLARYAQSNTFASELEQLEQQHELEPSVLHSGIFARAYIAFFRADFPTALRLFESLVPPESEPSVFHGNQPGRVLALGHLACVRWVAGDSERALSEAQATLQLANELGVPIFQALGHVVLGRLRYLRRDPLGVVELEAQQALGTTSVDLGLFTEAGAFSLWARAQRAPLPLSAIEPMLEGLQQRLQEVSTCSTLLAQVLIDVLRVSGHAVRARDLTEKIISFAVEQGELVYLPELLRLRGEQLESTDATAAARDYQEAIALARATGARSLEQRAGESLARLRHGS